MAYSVEKPLTTESLTGEITGESLLGQIEAMIKSSIEEVAIKEQELLYKIERILNQYHMQGPSQATQSIPFTATTLKEDFIEPIITIGNVRLDHGRRRVWCESKLIDLSKTEYDVLRYLVLKNGSAATREELLLEVWGYEHVTGTRAVDDMIKRIRKKIKALDANVSIKTVRGVGFYMDACGE